MEFAYGWQWKNLLSQNIMDGKYGPVFDCMQSKTH